MYLIRYTSAVATRDIIKSDDMRKKKKHILDLYIGGERDPPSDLSPERYGHFFSKKRLLIVFIILVIMLLIAGVSL